MSSSRYYRNAYAELDRGCGTEPSDEATFELRISTGLAAVRGSARQVLDFGCGDGSATRRFLESGHFAVGVDVSESAIRVAKRRVPGGTFHQIDDDCSLPFPNETFDVCLCTEVLEHILNVKVILQEIRRVLKPGGQLLVTVPYHGWLKNMILVTVAFERHFDPKGGHIRFFSMKSLRALIEAAGFRIVSAKGLGRFWPLHKSLFVSYEVVAQ